MSHQVRTHTRTVNGKTVTVRQHKAADPEAAERKRAAFERRVLRERQQAQTAQLRERQGAYAGTAARWAADVFEFDYVAGVEVTRPSTPGYMPRGKPVGTRSPNWT